MLGLGVGIAAARSPLEFAGEGSATVGIFIASVNGDTILEAYNADKLMTPASVLKSFTTAAALKAQGGDYSWQTKVYGVGEITDSVLNGNLVVVGSGDPTLGSRHFQGIYPDFIEYVRDAAKAKGIARIAGRVEKGSGWPDQGALPSWEVSDTYGEDGCGFYTLNYKDNVFKLDYPSLNTTPHIPNLQVKTMGGRGYLRFTRNAGSNTIKVYGNPRQRRTFLCSTPNPGSVLVYELEQAFNAGLNDSLEVKADTFEVATYQSPELREVARSLMTRSDNMMAEGVLRVIVPGQDRREALKQEREIFESMGVNLDDAVIYDGSGLSRHNALTPRMIGSVLAAMAGNDDYTGSFAHVGLENSTLRRFMTDYDEPESIVLKSGSLAGVVCYAGYHLDPETMLPTHVIVVMVNHAPATSRARAAIGSYLSRIDFSQK